MSDTKETTPEDRARALVDEVIEAHKWPECGFQGDTRSKICPIFRRELIHAIAQVLIIQDAHP